MATPPHVTRHTLSHLNRLGSLTLIESIVERRGLSAEVVDQIVQRTNGVPLYIEELTKNFLESAGDAQVPASLQDSLMARLDRQGSAKEMAHCLGATSMPHGLPVSATLKVQYYTRHLSGWLTHKSCADARPGQNPPSVSTTPGSETLRTTDCYWRAGVPCMRGLRKCSRMTPPLLSEAQPELVAQHFEKSEKNGDALQWWHLASARAASRPAREEAAAAHDANGLRCVARLPSAMAPLRTELMLQRAQGSVLNTLKGSSAAEAERAYAVQTVGRQRGTVASAIRTVESPDQPKRTRCSQARRR